MAVRGTSLYEYCITHPEVSHLLDEFDCTRNIISTHEITCKNSTKNVWWYCKKCGYSWQEYCYNRVNYPATPCCSGRHATKTNNFAVLYPNLLKDWDYSKNTISPYEILPGSHERVYWKCHICSHKWSTKLCSRTIQDADCPECSKAQTSKSERMILEYLKETFPNTTHQRGDRKGTPEIDIIIPEIKVAIEYDGYPWHLDKIQTHIDKLNYCNSQGYILINIAEYKNTPEIIQAVKAQYTPNHRVIYLDTTGNYNRENVIYLVYDFFTQNGVKLIPITEAILSRIRQDVRRGERNDCLWNNPNYQWLHYWIIDEESIKIAKAYTHGSGEVKLKVTCPNCGRTIEKTPHYITRKFQGCVDKKNGCGCQAHIPDSHILKIKEDYAKTNKQRAEKRRQNKDGEN